MSAPLSHHPEPHPTTNAIPTAPRREPSLTRGRPLTAGGGHATTPGIGLPSASSPDGGLERKPSNSYGHHRQTSIVHGIQHSRNASFANSPLASPISPQAIAAAGSGNAQSINGRTMPQDELRDLPAANGVPAAANGTVKYPVASQQVAGDKIMQEGARRPERMHSGRSKRDPNHHRSQSRHHHHQQDLKTVGEYALHHLFNSFVTMADQKMARLLSDSVGVEPDMVAVCGPGVDPNFDQLITALGHIARPKPKPLIDTLMFWRKAKSERGDIPPIKPDPQTTNGSLIRRNTEPVQSQGAAADHGNEGAQAAGVSARQHAVMTMQADRRTTIAIYLLCRVLIEILGQSTLEFITLDMSTRLEDIIYTQLKSDPRQLETSAMRQANWAIFCQVLGVMSDINFESVSRRFLHDIQEFHPKISSKGIVTNLEESQAILLIRGTSSLHLKVTPDDAWERSCDFMLEIAKLFAESHGQAVKYAYCQLLNDLLLPIAANTSSNLNTPKWKLVVDTIRPRLESLLIKPKHWQEAFPLMAVLLCVSPADMFASRWPALLVALQPRLKERATRAMALRALCRLLWTYLYRFPDSHPATLKRLDEMIRLVFIPGKRSYLSTDPIIAEPFIQLIRIIGYHNQDLCFRSIIFPLMNSEMFISGKELRVENLDPERTVIGIRSFLAIMTDLEKDEQPPFPVTFQSDPLLDYSVQPGLPTSPRPALPLGSKSATFREERLSKPVITANFGEVAKDSYIKFCKILGDITIICDNTFGGQATLNERFSSNTPKTPMAEAFTFGRREELQISADLKQGFYELLHVAVQALPRCFSPYIDLRALVNLLCTGTAHVQSNIALSSAQSLKSIARQSHAQRVTVGFSNFIFDFDNRYATMSDGGMMGPGHIENTLRLYVELLEIWIEEIRAQAVKALLDSPDDGASNTRGAQLQLSVIGGYVDGIESHGLFFLCSPSRRVRAYAVKVLRLITEFDKALGQDSSRIIRIMEDSSQKVLEVNKDKLTTVELSRLQKGMKKGNMQSTLVELCASEVDYDSSLWLKIFPNLVRISFDDCFMAVTQTRDIVCTRLLQMQKTISMLAADASKASPYPSTDPNKSGTRITGTSPEITLEQWKLYLVFAATTLMNLGPQATNVSLTAHHIRKSSKSSQKGPKGIESAGELFTKVLPYLSSENTAVRDATVAGLGSINKNLYRTLLESLHPAVQACAEEAKSRIGMHQRTISSPRHGRYSDHLRTEITHVYRLTSHYLHEPEIYGDEWILNNLVNYTKDLRLFLNDAEVQNEWQFQKLRTHYCGLVEELFEGIKHTKDPLRWMPFQARKAAFALMEDWCGYSPNQNQIRQREDHMKQSYLQREPGAGNKVLSSAAEQEKKDLRAAALSAMAALCGGPVSIVTSSNVSMTFDIRRMLNWIDLIFETAGDKPHATGRRALKNLIIHNWEHQWFLDRAIEKCYLAKSPKALESYFQIVTEVLLERPNNTIPFWKILSAGLYTLGNPNSEIRMKSARLLRVIEERQQKSSKLQDLDISISDKTIAVYKKAQFEVSRVLSKQHSELAFHVFSQFSQYFKELQPDQQRNMVAAMLPWIQTLELQLDPNGGPTASSYMLLVNLFEITVKCGAVLHNEIQAMWQALATGPHGGNVQLILDFIMSLCLEKREQSFVDYSKQIVVHLSSTPAGQRVLEYLLMRITPKHMVPDKDYAAPPPPEAQMLPYLADLGSVLPSTSRSSPFALAYVCLILLVDLMVSPVQLSKESVPLLLQAVMVLWDSHTQLVQEQAREMLVHLIHELVISKMDDDAISPNKRAVEDFIDSIRQQEANIGWEYEEHNGRNDDPEESGLRVPGAMRYVATEVVKIFSIAYPKLRADWGRVTLQWATSCQSRHVACRSFQLFRCILSISDLDQKMLADMLARLSNTISDDVPEYMTFSMEVLTTLRTVIEELTRSEVLDYPNLFWTICACLETINEGEFMECLAMLDKLLQKLDLSDPAVVRLLKEKQPKPWELSFDLPALVYKGLRSSVCLDRTLKILLVLAQLPDSDLVGNESRLAFTLLGELPVFLHSFQQPTRDSKITETVDTLLDVAESQGRTSLTQVLSAFAKARYRSEEDFLAQVLTAIRSSYFPKLEFEGLVFLLGLLSNTQAWYKIKVMRILCVLIPDINMRSPEIASKGPDLISPLLRLLQTEFCPQALEVLDNVMTMSGAATPMDRHHLRMSMAGSHSSRAFRKEYEKTQSLYGIPEATGWSIPMPAIHTTATRNNVHAVFSACNGSAGEAEVTTPNIEFRADEYPFKPPISDYRTETMTSTDDSRGDGHIGDLVQKLDSLDDFFDDEDMVEDNLSAGLSSPSPGVSRFNNSPLSARENVYDQQTFPILHKSLARNASVSSFQTGFSDLKMPPSAARDPGIMTPTAFNVAPSITTTGSSTAHSSISTIATSIAPSTGSSILARPGLHGRSITSPAVNQRSPPNATTISPLAADMDTDHETFSDDDISIGSRSRSNTLKTIQSNPVTYLDTNSVINSTSHPYAINGPNSAGEKPFSLENVIRPLAQSTRSGFRSGMRRLTGGGSDAKEKAARDAVRQVAQAQGVKSPQVPKVPDVYLQKEPGSGGGPSSG